MRLGAALLLAGGALSAAAAPALTAEERQWLAGHAKSIRVGVIDIPPLVITGNAGAESQGMSIRFLRMYEASLGVRFNLLVYPDWKSLLDAARNRQVDALLTAVNTPERRTYLTFPEPYITLKNVLIGRKGEGVGQLDLAQLSGSRVAVQEASAVHERMLSEYSGVHIVPLRDERALLASVASHDVDFAIVELSRAVWWMQHERQSALRVVGSTPLDYPLSLAVRSDWSLLASALDKATRGFSKETVDDIVAEWQRSDALSWIESESGPAYAEWMVGGFVAGLVVVLGLMLLIRHRLVLQTAALRAQLEQTQLLRLRFERAEQKFRELAELTSDIFWETNERLVLVEYFGGGKAGAVDDVVVLGKAWWDLPLERVSQADFDFLSTRMNSREPFQRWVARWKESSGALRWIAVSGRPYFDERNNFCGYRGTCRDITQAREQEVTLTQALQRMEAVQNGTLSFLGLLLADGEMVECNRAAIDFVGADKSDLIGQPFWTLPWWRIDDEAEKLQQAIARARAGAFVRYDARVVDAAGVVHWIDFSLSPFYDEFGKLVYLVPEARDITEAKRASALLDNLMSSTGAVYGEAYFHKLVEAMGRLLSVRYVLIGRVLPERRSVRTLAVWAGGVIADNFEYDLEFTPCSKLMNEACCIIPRNVQSQFPKDILLQQMGVESYMGVPIYGSAGVPIGVLVVLHDKPLADTGSARRMMELFAVRVATEMDRVAYLDEIRALNAGLEERVAERTEALQQVNRELEAFSYSVSHDLRAPLRHIAGFIEMLGEDGESSLSSEGRRFMHIIGDSARRMGVMIDDLLALSRAGRSELRKSPVALRPLVLDVVENVKNGLGERSIVWTIGDLPTVAADRGLLTLALNNLVENAVKYSRDRSPAEIGVAVVDGPHVAGTTDSAEWIIAVRDNGIGFDMKYVGKLFGVFQRLHSDEEYEGTGIGLANVRRIVERHGGRVWAESQPGQGAVFYFSLPREPVPVTEQFVASRVVA